MIMPVLGEKLKEGVEVMTTMTTTKKGNRTKIVIVMMFSN